MPIEIKYLLWAAALTLIQAMIAALGTVTQAGLVRGVGNRDDMPALAGWAGRAHRAHRNMLESLVLFAVVVLVGEALNKFGPMTALGAAIFFWSRVGYAVVYLIGIPWIRTLLWGASIAGLVMIFLKLI